jgi:hypothetical protein
MSRDLRVKEMGVIFRREMVHAMLGGRKTQTRRLVTAKHFKRLGLQCDGDLVYTAEGPQWDGKLEGGKVTWCPYGLVDTRLWVRETWRVAGDLMLATEGKTTAGVVEEMKRRHRRCELDDQDIVYAADEYPSEHPGEYHPSIFMPRLASRITLRVTEVRIQRLHAISHDDAIAEGVDRAGGGWKNYLDESRPFLDPIHSFRSLWRMLHGDGAWDANPWVWAISFEEVTSCLSN